MKTVTIVYAHPWAGSFNKAVLDTVTKRCEEKANKVVVIDLYKDHFSPAMEEKSLYLFSKGKSADSMVENYQKLLLDTQELVFIFPIWWFSPPAIVKGFIEKVMLKNFAYIQKPMRMIGLLKTIEKTTVITTSEIPTRYIRTIGGNPIKGIFIRNTLKKLGLNHIKWLNCGRTVSGSKEKRQNFLSKVSRII